MIPRRRTLGDLPALALALVSACGAAPPSPPSPPEALLGTGYDTFTLVTDGDAVPIIHGLQGGYHVWGDVRARGLAPDSVDLHFTLTVDGDATPLSIRDDDAESLAPASDGSDWQEHRGTQIFLPDPMRAAGHPCHLRLVASDASGRSATVERAIVPTFPDGASLSDMMAPGGPSPDGGT